MTHTHDPIRPTRGASGFTLVELLLATSLGAILVISAAATAGVFAETVAELDQSRSSEVDQALAQVNADVRYAWWADVPADDRLQVANPDGQVTEYYLHDGSLKVRRPSGSIGELARGVASLAFTPQQTRRLREGSLVVRAGPIAELPATIVPAMGLMLEPGDELVLAFTTPTDGGAGDVEDVREQIVSLQPQRLEIKLARATATASTLEVVLVETRAPGEAAPRSGGAVGSQSFAVLSLPLTSHIALPLLDPDGSGPLSGVVLPPSSTLSLDLSSMPALQPGRGYALVLRVVGTNARVVLAAHIGVGTRDDVAFKGDPGGSYDKASYVVAYRLTGTASATSTVAHRVTQVVHTALATTDGRAVAADAPLLGQVLATDPWAGAVPGEVPGLSTHLLDGIQVVRTP